MDGPAIDLLLSGIGDMQSVARIVALNGLGYRALRDDDSSAKDLRTRLLPVFESHLSQDPSDPEHSWVTASIAWCYLKAWSQRFGSPPPAGPWPAPSDEETDQRKALEMMCSMTPTGPRLLPEHRSVQLAFLQAQYMALEDPDRPISVVHYLYYLVVARRHGAHVVELGRELPLILRPDSPIAEVIRSYALVPELARVLETCSRIHESI
jgi:hypothetical protein